MQRKATKQSPGPTAAAKSFIAWTAYRPCVVCGNEPVIVHHIYGSAKKLYVGVERVPVGHWAVLPLCQQHDDIVTNRSRRVFEDEHGQQESLWIKTTPKHTQHLSLIHISEPTRPY